jgi:hypothetical protein
MYLIRRRINLLLIICMYIYNIFLLSFGCELFMQRCLELIIQKTGGTMTHFYQKIKEKSKSDFLGINVSENDLSKSQHPV